MAPMRESMEGAEPDYYSTSIYKYDISNANDSQWSHFRTQLDSKLNEILEDYRAHNSLESNQQPRVKGIQKPQSGLTHPNIMVGQLNEAIEEAVKTSFSLKKAKKPGNMIPKWVRDLMSKKKSLSKQYNTTKSWIRLKEIREEIKVIYHRLKESYEEVRDRRENKFIPLLQDDPASFYSYANSFARNRSEIGPLVKDDGDSTLDPKAMAQILAKQYNSVYTNPQTDFTASLDASDGMP